MAACPSFPHPKASQTTPLGPDSRPACRHAPIIGSVADTSGRALYLVWRPRRFDDVVGQPHVVRTIRNAVRNGTIAHAYLFSGPRGTGKTTMARLLFKAVNCLQPIDGGPCEQCAICTSANEGRALDLIEMDAASNRGIDDVRDLRDKINYSPAEARYRVYILDEAHQLTQAAWDALLKTLEEPPPHAILVLATTESHKVPADGPLALPALRLPPPHGREHPRSAGEDRPGRGHRGRGGGPLLAGAGGSRRHARRDQPAGPAADVLRRPHRRRERPRGPGAGRAGGGAAVPGGAPGGAARRRAGSAERGAGSRHRSAGLPRRTR